MTPPAKAGFLTLIPMQGQEHTESELLQFRRDKLTALQGKGVDAFGSRFDITHQPGALRKDFAADLEVKAACRCT